MGPPRKQSISGGWENINIVNDDDAQAQLYFISMWSSTSRLPLVANYAIFIVMPIIP